jgi:hypothetical protein
MGGPTSPVMACKMITITTNTLKPLKNPNLMISSGFSVIAMIWKQKGKEGKEK